MQIVVVMAMKWAGDRTITRISLRDYESTAHRADFSRKFTKGKAGSRESPDLFSRKSTSTRGCNQSCDAAKGAGPAICENRGVGVWYGPKENSLRLLSFPGFKAGLLEPGCAEVIHRHDRALRVIVPVLRKNYPLHDPYLYKMIDPYQDSQFPDLVRLEKLLGW